MLKGLSGQDLINQNLIQGNNVEKLTSAKKKSICRYRQKSSNR